MGSNPKVNGAINCVAGDTIAITGPAWAFQSPLSSVTLGSKYTCGSAFVIYDNYSRVLCTLPEVGASDQGVQLAVTVNLVDESSAPYVGVTYATQSLWSRFVGLFQ